MSVVPWRAAGLCGGGLGAALSECLGCWGSWFGCSPLGAPKRKIKTNLDHITEQDVRLTVMKRLGKATTKNKFTTDKSTQT